MKKKVTALLLMLAMIIMISTNAYGTELTHDAKYDLYEKIYGIDVSKWQGTVDWESVKKAGIEFAILRIGYRASATGKLCVDQYFDANMKGAKEAGIHLGVYFYTQAISNAEAKEEAQFVLNQLKSYPGYLSYPVFFDIENTATDRMGKAKVTTTLRTSMTKEFCDTVKSAGYVPGVYASFNYFLNCLNVSELEQYELWLARYSNTPSYQGKLFPNDYSMWQYSSTGRVDGIAGNVDMNVYYRKSVPEIPSGLKQTESLDSEIVLSWEPTAYTDGYQIVCMDGDGNKLTTAKTSVPEYRLTQLTNGENRKFKVRGYSVNRDGTYMYGKFSSEISAYTLPAKVEDVVQSECDRTSVTMEWEPVLGAVGYRIRTYDAANKTYKTCGTTTAGSYKITGLTFPETKALVVDAYVLLNGSTKKYGKKSEVCTVETGLGQVSDVRTTNQTSDTITLTWDYKEEVSGYEVNCYDENAQLISRDEVEGEVFTSKKLEAATEYQFDVRCYLELEDGKRWYGDYSDMYGITTLPEQVTGVRAEKVEAEGLTLTWDNTDRASGYQIYTYDPNTRECKLLQTMKSNFCEIGSLSANTVYQYKVAAYIEYENETYCGEASDSFEAITKPAKLTGMKVTNVKKDRVTFTWNAQENVSGYRVYLYDKNTKKSKFVKATAKNSYTLKGLSGSTNYYVKVKAYHKWNNSTYYGTASNLFTVKTK